MKHTKTCTRYFTWPSSKEYETRRWMKLLNKVSHHLPGWKQGSPILQKTSQGKIHPSDEYWAFLKRAPMRVEEPKQKVMRLLHASESAVSDKQTWIAHTKRKKICIVPSAVLPDENEKMDCILAQYSAVSKVAKKAKSLLGKDCEILKPSSLTHQEQKHQGFFHPDPWLVTHPQHKRITA